MESVLRHNLPLDPRAALSSGMVDNTSGKGLGGSGTGSSEDSLANEVGRLSEENARYRQKIADLMGKSTALPSSTRGGSSSHSGGSSERMLEQIRRLKKENYRLTEQNATLERRLSCSRSTASGDQLWRYKEEVRSLRARNAELMREKEKFDRTAEYVCQKVLKIISAARREGNFNSQLVGELKRWNEKLEDENHRLYNIIDRMQSKGNDVQDAVNEATVLSKNHDKDRDGNAAIVKELETQNVKIQEEMTKLSDQALSLQNLSSSSSGSSGPLPPRTPSNHEMDGTALRRSRTPDKDSMKSFERQRSGEPRRKQNRTMSIESVGSASKDEFEFLKQKDKKYTEDLERIGADLAFVREQVAAKSFNEKTSPRVDMDKSNDVSARVASLEHANSQQAVEIERLQSTQLEFKSQSDQYFSLKEEFAELEDDCLKLASEVERLQAVADRVKECEAEVEAYREQLKALEQTGASAASDEAERMKLDQVEMQRTLSAMAAEKAVLQAELRELLEERTQLQLDMEDLDMQVRDLQERANSATYLQTELEVAKEENLSYAKEIENLQIEKDQLKAEIRELSEKNNSSFVRASSQIQARVDERDAEIANLRAENENLTAKSYNHVILNVELTTLRNQVKDMQDMEARFNEQIQALRNERNALQKDADSVPTLKAEIAELQNKIHQAETQQGKREAELVAMQNSPRQSELLREHEERGRRVRELLERNGRAESELGRAETRLKSLQAKYDSLLRDHTQRSQQAMREMEEAESTASVLNLALKQERTKTANLGREAAELHSLLQTAHNERQSIQTQFVNLRNENARLVQRVTELDAKNEEQERTLETVLSNRDMTNGHGNPQREESNEPLRVDTVFNESPSRQSPFDSVASPTKKLGKSQEMNGKSDKNGFTSLFKRRTKGIEKPKHNFSQENLSQQANLSQQGSQPEIRRPQSSSSSLSRDFPLNGGNPEQEVMDVYDRFVDSDDIDGFMTALGYKGFRPPTSYDDMKGAFASAKYVVRPEALLNMNDYQRQKAEATHDLLEAWHGAWLDSLE